MAGTRHTKKPGRARSCTAKKPFRSHRAAAAYREWRIRQGAAEWTCEVYRCRFCGFRHVGHRSAEKYLTRSAR